MNQHLLREKAPLFLKSIGLRNFRNYETAHIDFGPKINVIEGNNAVGKTNLLEAISLISTGRSFRTQHLGETVGKNGSFFYIEASIVKETISHTVSLFFDGKQKKLVWNGNPYSSFGPLLGVFPSIISLPGDTELITHSPTLRRKFINLHLAQSDALYLHHFSRFWRALKQRNCLLKAKRGDALDCFEMEMALSANYIYVTRSQFLDTLASPFQKYSHNLSTGAESVSVRFQPTYPPLCASYTELLKKMRKQEFEVGHTLKGPHRDDISFLINEVNADTFASEGQKKTLAIALRLAEWEHLHKNSGVAAWMAIDDISSMLDHTRLEKLLLELQPMEQVFLTTPHPLPELTNAHSIFLPLK